MYNNLVNRAITAMNNAGFEVLGFKKKDYGPLKLKVVSAGPEPGELGYKGTPVSQRSPELSIVKRSPGETCDLVRYLGASDWRHALSLTQEVIRAGNTAALNVGDFIRVSFCVPEASHKDVNFKNLNVTDAKVQIVHISPNKIIFNFDGIIFLSAINAKNKNDGGFKESALAEYLNNEFLAAMDISYLLLENNNEQDISLPTAFELFGDEEYWAPESNYFDEPRQIDFFKNIKNRIKVWEGDTHWHWTSSARASSSSNFCHVNINGNSNHDDANSVGGVAPVFCVA